MDSDGQTIWIVDAHRDNGKRFVVRSDGKLTAFVGLESAIRSRGELQTSTANGSQQLVKHSSQQHSPILAISPHASPRRVVDSVYSLFNGADESRRWTHRTRFASKYRALPLGVPRRSHIRGIRHLARSIRDVGSGGRRESVAAARLLSSTLS